MGTRGWGWVDLPYEAWAPTCDTLHAHTQVLGKLAVALAPAEPGLQHTALRLTARGWETATLPVADGRTLGVAIDLRTHETTLACSDGGTRSIPLSPNRPVGDVTREVLAAVASLVGPVQIDPTPQEVAWTAPLDADVEHATYDVAHVARYFAAATAAAGVLRELRAPYGGRVSPVNAWWGHFDLAVNFFSGRAVDPPATGYLARHTRDAELLSLGWWPGDADHPAAAFFGYAFPWPGPPDPSRASTAFFDAGAGEYLFEWDAALAAPDPRAAALRFGRDVLCDAAAACKWSPELLATLEG